MRRHIDKAWGMSILMIVIAIVSLSLDKVFPMSLFLHHLLVAFALVLILMSPVNYAYQQTKKSEKSSKHTWWLDDNWFRCGDSI